MKRLIAILLCSIGILSMAACGGGGGGGDAQPQNPPASSNWDSMVWDKDKWS